MGNRLSTRALVEGGLMVALAFVLSKMAIFRMPQGGSLTLASMAPIFVVAIRWGLRPGLLAGLALGLLQLFDKPEVVHWAQFLLDYPIAFAMLGLAGLFPGQPILGGLVGASGRLAAHILSGVIFFGQYAPEGQNVWVYSTLYNVTYWAPDLVLSLAAASAIAYVLKTRGLDRVEAGAR